MALGGSGWMKPGKSGVPRPVHGTALGVILNSRGRHSILPPEAHARRPPRNTWTSLH